METKECNRCEKNKTITEFPKKRNSYEKNCKICMKELKKENIINSAINGKLYCETCDLELDILLFKSSKTKCINCQRKQWREYRRSDTGREKAQTWSTNNKEQHAKLQAKWYQESKPKIREKYNERYHNDPEFKLHRVCSKRIIMAIKKKTKSTDKYVGCKTDELLKWFEFCFEDCMTFENHGSLWHVDHVIPVDTFDLTDEYQQMICFNWKNLSPVLAVENLTKNNKILKNQVNEHIRKLKEFHIERELEVPTDYIKKLKSYIKC